MNSVSNRIPVNYTAVNVGVLTPPDHLARYGGLSDSEMEKHFQELNSGIDKKVKHLSFEDRKHTPVLVKFIAIGVGVCALFKGGMKLFKK